MLSSAGRKDPTHKESGGLEAEEGVGPSVLDYESWTLTENPALERSIADARADGTKRLAHCDGNHTPRGHRNIANRRDY